MSVNSTSTRDEIRRELETTRTKFQRLLDSLSEQDFQKQSLNPGWTNGEIMAHITFGFIVINVLLSMARLWGRLPKGSSQWFARLLNSFTDIFNVMNMVGGRVQGKAFTYKRIGKIYDRVYLSLLKKVDSIHNDEWQHGMYYPTKWDSNFDEFMTLENLFHYPVTHLNFHSQQIAPQKTR